MPITLSGRNVDPVTSTDHPSLLDIAVGLSRAPRFAGQTKCWWSVLDHTLFGAAMIRAEKYLAEPLRVERAWLLHDAHEAVTGDVPSPIKGDDLRRAQDELDRRIYGAYGQGLNREDAWLHGRVKDYDRRALAAEAAVVGPSDRRDIFGYPRESDVALLHSMLGRVLGRPPYRYDQHRHPQVRQYVGRMIELM